MKNYKERINANLIGEFSETDIRQIEAHEAGPFTNCPKIQPHEEAAVEADRQVAAVLRLNEHDTEAYIKNRVMVRRKATYIRQQEQLRIGENVSIILSPALKREHDRLIASDPENAERD